jgi:hypothetical protein
MTTGITYYPVIQCPGFFSGCHIESRGAIHVDSDESASTRNIYHHCIINGPGDEDGFVIGSRHNSWINCIIGEFDNIFVFDDAIDYLYGDILNCILYASNCGFYLDSSAASSGHLGINVMGCGCTKETQFGGWTGGMIVASGVDVFQWPYGANDPNSAVHEIGDNPFESGSLQMNSVRYGRPKHVTKDGDFDFDSYVLMGACYFEPHFPDYPAESDVRNGVDYNTEHETQTGTLDLPAESNVRDGVTYDNETKEGTLDVPTESDVRDGVAYDDGVGTLDVPAESDVRDGVAVDDGVGTLDVPAESDVRDSVAYDNETKEGTLDVPGASDVRDGVAVDDGVGTLDVPGASDVRDGVAVDDGVGTLDLPAESDVRDSVAYDNGTKEGTLDVPTESDVRSGVAVDDGVGTLDVPTESDVRDGVAVDDGVGTLDLPSEADVKLGVDFDNNTKAGTFDARRNLVFKTNWSAE